MKSNKKNNKKNNIMSDIIPFLYPIVVIESYTKNSSKELQQQLKNDLIQWGKNYYKKNNYNLPTNIDKLKKTLNVTPELGKLLVDYHQHVTDFPILYDFTNYAYKLIGEHLDEIDPYKSIPCLETHGLSLKTEKSKSELRSTSNLKNNEEGTSR